MKNETFSQALRRLLKAHAAGLITDSDLHYAVGTEVERHKPVAPELPVVTLVETPPPSPVRVGTESVFSPVCPFCGAEEWCEMATRGHSIDVWCSHCGGILQAG